MEYQIKQPFDWKGQYKPRKEGWRHHNGIVTRGGKIKASQRQGSTLMKKGLIYETKEEKRAYIVAGNGNWFEVRMGTKSQKVNGKANAQTLRDQWNAKS